MLGGLLLQHFSWHAVFWINVPAVCVTLAAGAVLMPESRNPVAPPLDVLGALLCPGAVACLVWGLINGPEHGWTALATWPLLAGSAVLLAAFIARERRSAHPVIDLTRFRDRRFTWGTAASIAVSVALYGILFVLGTCVPRWRACPPGTPPRPGPPSLRPSASPVTCRRVAPRCEPRPAPRSCAA